MRALAWARSNVLHGVIARPDDGPLFSWFGADAFQHRPRTRTIEEEVSAG